MLVWTLFVLMAVCLVLGRIRLIAIGHDLLDRKWNWTLGLAIVSSVMFQVLPCDTRLTRARMIFAALLAVFVLFFVNRKAWSVKFILPFGVALNLAVICANGWQMPVNASASQNPQGIVAAVSRGQKTGGGTYRLADKNTALPALCDTIAVGQNALMSIGDLFIFGGIILFPFTVKKKK